MRKAGSHIPDVKESIAKGRFFAVATTTPPLSGSARPQDGAPSHCNMLITGNIRLSKRAKLRP
jgi:hypothetical protein